MRVVVTGGAGFIGANLVRRLADDASVDEVVVLDDLSTGERSNLAGVDAEVRAGSVLDPEGVDEACVGADALVHLAARPSVPRSIEDPVATHEANATGTLAVLEAARAQGVAHTIVASSSSVYGRSPALPKHEDLPPDPLSPYAASKLAAEGYAAAYAAAFGLEVLTLRFFNVFGPLQPAGHAYAAAIPAFVDAALAGRPVPIFGDGKQTRDFTYVGSVCAIIAEALRRRVVCDGPVNLAFGSRRSLLEVVEVLERLLDRRLEVTHHPPRAGDVRHSQADQRRLRGLFPAVEPVPFEEGLAETIRWFENSR